MKYENIGRETEQVEFKKSTGELKEGVISIASILNKHGSGDVYFGVKNNGDVIGQEISDSTTRDVSQAIRANIKPAIFPTIEIETYGGRDVVHVHFEESQRPYTAYNIPRIRIADEDTVMDQAKYYEMLHARDGSVGEWETRYSRYHVQDINREIFDGYLRRAKQVGRITIDTDEPRAVLNTLGVAVDEDLLNAGAALFVESGINELQMAKFASDERLTFNDIKRYTRSIFSLAERAVQYVADAMDWRVEFDGSLERKEFPEVPVDAVREAVINAFGHRIIESRQAVEVAIYKSYIDIYSPGKFPDGVEPEQFIQDQLKPIRRNPVITQILYYSKDMESFATGLKRINEACEPAGVKYEFIKEPNGFTVRFHRHCGEGWNSSESAFYHQGERKGDRKGEKRIQLLTAVREEPQITMKKMSERTGMTKRQIERLIQELRAEGILRREGPKKGGRWVIDEQKADN